MAWPDQATNTLPDGSPVEAEEKITWGTRLAHRPSVASVRVSLKILSTGSALL